MEELEQYGELSNEELLDFLNELEQGDDDLIVLDNSHPAEALEDGAWGQFNRWKGDEKERLFSHKEINLWDNEAEVVAKRKEEGRLKGIEVHKEKSRLRRQNKIDMQRLAFAQADIPLTRVITKEQLSTLIELLTADYRSLLDKYHTFINKRLTLLLRPYIPKPIKYCYATYPDSMKVNPGFMYLCSAEYGESKSFWASPDIPCFFVQGSENDILRNNKAKYLFSLEKAILQYYNTLDKISSLEVKYASKLVQMKNGTFYDLLKISPFWFEMLYNNITGKILKHGKNSTTPE